VQLQAATKSAQPPQTAENASRARAPTSPFAGASGGAAHHITADSGVSGPNLYRTRMMQHWKGCEIIGDLDPDTALLGTLLGPRLGFVARQASEAQAASTSHRVGGQLPGMNCEQSESK
jgi:hypothetical protein